MSVTIPYGASGAWSLDNDIAEIAAHYRLKFKTLKRSDGRAGGLVAEARDALAWKLVEQRKFSIERAAQLIGLNGKSVREAKARHVHRITSFNARFSPVIAEVFDADGA
jgi:hypothetical protein